MQLNETTYKHAHCATIIATAWAMTAWAMTAWAMTAWAMTARDNYNYCG